MEHTGSDRALSRALTVIATLMALLQAGCHSQQRIWGSAATVTDGARSVSDAVRTAPYEKTISVQGKVRSVCPDDGCWMLIEDGANALRVELPTDVFEGRDDWKSQNVVVEGELERKIVPSSSPGYSQYRESCEQGALSALGMNQATVLRAHRVELH